MRPFEEGTKFVVLSSQRSGSTWLVSLLNQVEATRAYGELFLRRKKADSEQRWDDHLNYPHFPEVQPKGRRIRPRLVFTYLNALYCQPGAVGFKLMYTQVQKYSEIVAYLFIYRIRIVHLVRQNQLDVLISRAVKNKTKRAHLLAGSSPLEDIQVEINPQKLLGRLKRRQKKIQTARRLLQWSTLPHMEVTYEDLLNDSSSFQRVCCFLSINAEEYIPQSALVKVNRKSHPELISNYQEIKRTLIGTPFARYI